MPGRRQHRLRRRSMHRLHRRYGRGGCWRGRSCRGRRQLRRAEADRRSLQRLRGNRKRCRCHSAGIGKYPGRHDGCRAAVGELLVRHLWRRVVRSPRRRDCLYFGDIGHADIGDIDVADINRIAGIVRPIHLARRKREPADRRPGFERCRRANAGILDKGDKRRRIDGLRNKIARHPAPALVDAGPASVVKRRKAPGLRINPVPSPRLDPDPVAVAVGSPIGGHRFRVPDRAVIWNGVPAAIGVKLLEAGHCGGHVIRRSKPLLMVIARATPFDEVVYGGPLDRRRDGIVAAQHNRVTGPDDQIGSAADKAGAALEYGDPRRLVRSPGFDVVNTALEQPDAAAGDIDLDALVRAELAHIHIDPPLGHAGFDDTVAKIGDVELGVARDIDRLGADTNFGAGLRIGRKPLPGGDRVVDLGR